MQKSIKQLLPQWAESEEKFDLILSNDLDSLLSCMVLKEVKGYDIKYFYDFNAIYSIDGQPLTEDVIGVDIALIKGKCFDNHVTKMSKYDWFNNEAINLNNIYGACGNDDMYFTKYNLSTALLVYSYYDFPLPETEEGKMILLAIDSSYMGYYNGFERDKEANKKFLCDVLDMEELYNIQVKNKCCFKFANLDNKYNLSRKIFIDNDGYLKTNINLDRFKFKLPSSRFIKIHDLNNKGKKYYCNHFKVEDDKAFSLAITGRNYVSYSYIQ